MKGINIMLVSGYLTKDPQKWGKTGKCSKFSVSVPAGDDKWDVVTFKAFGKEAQRILFLTTGTEISVIAHTQDGKYESQGKTVYTTDNIVDRLYADLPGFTKMPYGLRVGAEAINKIKKEET